MTISQHAVCADESIHVPTWTRSQGGQVHYTDAVAGASNDRWQSSALSFLCTDAVVVIAKRKLQNKYVTTAPK